MKLTLAVGKYFIAAILCIGGAMSAIDGVAYFEGVVGEGILARLFGVVSIVFGLLLAFRKERHRRDDAKSGQRSDETGDHGITKEKL